MSNEQSVVWQGHSGQWARVGSPLRPSRDDGRLMLELLSPIFARAPVGCDIAVLGVTPEVVQLDWPLATRIEAFDSSASMLARVWTPNERISSRARLAHWQALPVPAARFDAIVGDGSLNALPTYDAYRVVLRELWRVTRPEAGLVVRCFMRPEQPETLQVLKQDLLAGAIGSFHVLKWRLAMLLSANAGGIVSVRVIHEVFDREFSRAELVSMTGWDPGVIDTIDAYRAMPTIYTFPTVQQLCDVCGDGWMLDRMEMADYELARACPTLRFVRRPEWQGP